MSLMEQTLREDGVQHPKANDFNEIREKVNN